MTALKVEGDREPVGRGMVCGFQSLVIFSFSTETKLRPPDPGVARWASVAGCEPCAGPALVAVRLAVLTRRAQEMTAEQARGRGGSRALVIEELGFIPRVTDGIPEES